MAASIHKSAKKQSLQIDAQEEKVIKGMLQERCAQDLDWRGVGERQLQAVYDCYWRREDPTMQLPPGEVVKLCCHFG